MVRLGREGRNLIFTSHFSRKYSEKVILMIQNEQREVQIKNYFKNLLSFLNQFSKKTAHFVNLITPSLP